MLQNGLEDRAAYSPGASSRCSGRCSRASRRSWMPPEVLREIAGSPPGARLRCSPARLTIDSLIFGNDQSRSFENQTIRHIVHTSVGGKRREGAALERVRLSAIAGRSCVRGAAALAQSSIYPGTNRRLTFSGQTSIVVPAGAVAVSDAVDLDVPGARDLAVSVYLPTLTEPATYHEQTMQVSYITGAGNFTNVADLTAPTSTQSTYYLSVVEVLPGDSIGTLVALGDSITQGAGSIARSASHLARPVVGAAESISVAAAAFGDQPGHRLRTFTA